MSKNRVESTGEGNEFPEIDFSKIKRKRFEQMCREDYGIVLGERYTLEVLEDIDFKHWNGGKKDEHEAKFNFKLKKGTRLTWLADSNRKVIKLRFEGNDVESLDSIRNQGDFKFDRVVQSEDGESEYRVRSKDKDYGKSTLKKSGTICIPAGFFWAMFHVENGSKNIKIYNSAGNVQAHVKDVVDTVLTDEDKTK